MTLILVSGNTGNAGPVTATTLFFNRFQDLQK